MEDETVEELRRENQNNSHSIKRVASVSFDKTRKKFDYSNFQPEALNCGDK